MKASTIRLAIVVAQFNEEITSDLLAGALAAFEEAGLAREEITVTHVPGAFELPFLAKKYATSGEYDVVVCLGAVIRGETAHFDFVAAEAARGIMNVGIETGIPIIFGVLTTDNWNQAHERAEPQKMNKGREFALAAIEMARFSCRRAIC